MLNSGLGDSGGNPDSIKEKDATPHIAQEVTESFAHDFVLRAKTDKDLDFKIWITYIGNPNLVYRGERFFKRKKNIISKKNFEAKRKFRKIKPKK
jgi:hypothetical protein